MKTEHQLSEAKLTCLRLAQQLVESLTEAECRVVLHAITKQGLTARQIAGCTGASQHTVETRIKKIRTKAAKIYQKYVTFSFIVFELKCYFFFQSTE